MSSGKVHLFYIFSVFAITKASCVFTMIKLMKTMVRVINGIDKRAVKAMVLSQNNISEKPKFWIHICQLDFVLKTCFKRQRDMDETEIYIYHTFRMLFQLIQIILEVYKIIRDNKRERKAACCLKMEKYEDPDDTTQT